MVPKDVMGLSQKSLAGEKLNKIGLCDMQNMWLGIFHSKWTQVLNHKTRTGFWISLIMLGLNSLIFGSQASPKVLTEEEWTL